MQRNRENNRMGKTKDLFKKIRATKEIFHANRGSIKDRNVRDLTEAENVKKRWQEYTEELYKKYHDPDNHDGVITYQEPDILECDVKWALGSITMNKAAAAAAAKSLQLCPTLCDSIDGSPPGSPVPGILQARTLEWVAISFSSLPV